MGCLQMANEKRMISVDAHELKELLSDCFDVIKSVKPTHLSLMGALQVWIGCCKGQPTVDAVEVVHGRWVFGTANHREYMKCSVCLKSQTPTGVFTYCPNCGAKMDGGNEDG